MIRLRPSGADEVLIKRVRDWYEPGSGVFIAPQALFNPAMLFTGTTTGAWYDPSDTTTLFQDAAGTTPVTAVEQPVGLMLDKSKGLVLGSELVTVNSATYTGLTGYTAIAGNSTSVGKWYKYSYTLNQSSGASQFTVGSISAPVHNGAVSGVFSFIGYATSAGTPLFYSNNATGTISNVTVRELPGNHAFNSSGNSANFPVLSARYNQYLSTETLTTQNVTTVAANYTLSFTGTGSITLSGTATGTYSAGTHTITCTTGTLTSTVSGTVTKADLRVANDALNQPAYQRVNTSTDYDTVGFKPYLRFNGTNQWLQTNSIDFSYGDKMFVSAGVRKLSDAAVAILVELSANLNTNSGSLYIAAPSINGVSNYAFDSKGTIEKEITSIGYASPINNVVSGIGNISAPSVVLRANGAQVAQSTASQGTGNYGNYPMFIGARAGSSLWFNGRLYQMVVAGKQASAAEITSTETYLNQKTGAY